MKPTFARALHDPRPREGFGEEDHIRVDGLDLRDHPGPERDRLGVGIVDAEDPHPLLDPEEEDALRLLPERLALPPQEVQGVDVLVPLRRVLGVLDRPVGPVVEPLRVLGHPGMVRRALERVVQRDLEPAVSGGSKERAEVRQRPQGGIDRLVPPVLVADGPRGARVVGARLERVVSSLPEAPPDRMDRRQVDHVEAHVRDLRQPLDAVAERAGSARHPALGSREHLVPRGEPGQRPVHDHLELAVIARRRGSVRVDVEDLRDLLVEEEARPAVGVARRLEVAETHLEPPAVGSHDARESAAEGGPRLRGARS